MNTLTVILTAMLVVVSSVVTMPSATPAQGFDPQSLVGEWTGQWSTASNRGPVGGSVSITIKKVEGGKVYGESRFTGANSVPDGKFAGDLTERGYTLTTSRFVSVYTVEGDKMTGTSGAGGRVQLSLTRTK